MVPLGNGLTSTPTVLLDCWLKLTQVLGPITAIEARESLHQEKQAQPPRQR